MIFLEQDVSMRRLHTDFLRALPAKEFRITFSTLLTVVRIMLTPFVVYAMLSGLWGGAFILFTIAAATDFFDGFFARLLQQKTFFGTCLDPLADKFLLVSCFATLACTDALPFAIPHFFLGLILLREILLIGGAIAIYAHTNCIVITPSLLGKATTCMQIIFIMWLFSCYFLGWFPLKTYYFFLVLISGLIIGSFMQYGKKGIEQWEKNNAC